MYANHNMHVSLWFLVLFTMPEFWYIIFIMFYIPYLFENILSFLGYWFLCDLEICPFILNTWDFSFMVCPLAPSFNCILAKGYVNMYDFSVGKFIEMCLMNWQRALCLVNVSCVLKMFVLCFLFIMFYICLLVNFIYCIHFLNILNYSLPPASILSFPFFFHP